MVADASSCTSPIERSACYDGRADLLAPVSKRVGPIILVAGGHFDARGEVAVQVDASDAAGFAGMGHLAQVNGAADLADPAADHHADDVGAGDHAQPAITGHDGHALDMLAAENLGNLVSGGIFLDADDATCHNLFDGSAGPGKNIGLGDDADDLAVFINHRHTADVVV